MTDMVGRKFGRLTILELVGKNKYGMKMYKCECSCGNIKVIPVGRLTTGKTKSCGCYNREIVKQKTTKHGLRHTQIYKVWAGIKDRTNPNNHKCNYNYKKLGITMCEEWKNDFMSFYNWAITHDYKEEKLPNGRNKYEIDRIDTYGNYCPENCRWITSKEQMNNQTTNKRITYNGKTQTLAQWCEELNLKIGRASCRDRV